MRRVRLTSQKHLVLRRPSRLRRSQHVDRHRRRQVETAAGGGNGKRCGEPRPETERLRFPDEEKGVGFGSGGECEEMEGVGEEEGRTRSQEP